MSVAASAATPADSAHASPHGPVRRAIVAHARAGSAPVRPPRLVPVTAALRTAAFALACTVGLAGCLPSCRRDEDKSLVPADSIGRAVAALVPADTLVPAWTRDARTAPGLTYPRTVRILSGGALAGHVATADAATGDVWTVGPDGDGMRRHALGLDRPYLASVRGDTLVAYEVGVNRFALAVADSSGVLRVARRVVFTGLPADQTLVRYGASWGDGFAVKFSSEESGAGLLVLDASGRLVHRERLPGPHWRHAGPLRTHGDTLVSVCGFRPVVDRFTRTAAGGVQRDSLALVGFDSPMLARSRRFLTGDVSAPPLLMPSVAVLPGGDLVALSLRLGWIEAARFGSDGRLRARFAERVRFLNPDVLPDDLDVRPMPDGSMLVAVAVPRPYGRIVAFRWR